jgi:hypothetical protein
MPAPRAWYGATFRIFSDFGFVMACPTIREWKYGFSITRFAPAWA